MEVSQEFVIKTNTHDLGGEDFQNDFTCDAVTV